jgi:hypothetical protein
MDTEYNSIRTSKYVHVKPSSSLSHYSGNAWWKKKKSKSSHKVKCEICGSIRMGKECLPEMKKPELSGLIILITGYIYSLSNKSSACQELRKCVIFILYSQFA